MAHADDNGGGGSGAAANVHVVHVTQSSPAYKPPPLKTHLTLEEMDSDSDSDLSELSDGSLSQDDMDSDDSSLDFQSMSQAEQAEHEEFGQEYSGPVLCDEDASRLLVLMAHASTCPCRHKLTKHRDVCKSTKYLMLHVRDCPGTTSSFDICPFPWCRKVKHLLYHLVSCVDPESCEICSPANLSESLKNLSGLNEYRLKRHRQRIVAAFKATHSSRAKTAQVGSSRPGGVRSPSRKPSEIARAASLKAKSSSPPKTKVAAIRPITKHPGAPRPKFPPTTHPAISARPVPVASNATSSTRPLSEPTVSASPAEKAVTPQGADAVPVSQGASASAQHCVATSHVDEETMSSPHSNDATQALTEPNTVSGEVGARRAATAPTPSTAIATAPAIGAAALVSGVSPPTAEQTAIADQIVAAAEPLSTEASSAPEKSETTAFLASENANATTPSSIVVEQRARGESEPSATGTITELAKAGDGSIAVLDEETTTVVGVEEQKEPTETKTNVLRTDATEAVLTTPTEPEVEKAEKSEVDRSESPQAPSDAIGAVLTALPAEVPKASTQPCLDQKLKKEFGVDKAPVGSSPDNEESPVGQWPHSSSPPAPLEASMKQERESTPNVKDIPMPQSCSCRPPNEVRKCEGEKDASHAVPMEIETDKSPSADSQVDGATSTVERSTPVKTPGEALKVTC